MKILILKNKGVNKKFVEDEIKRLDYFSNLNRYFGIQNIPFSIDEQEVDFEVELKKQATAPNGKVGYTLKDIPDIPQGYDFVAIMYDGSPFVLVNGKNVKNAGNYAFSRPDAVNGAFVCEIPDNSDDYVLIHEMIHLFKHKLNALGYPAKEYMDSTKVNGEWVTYYKNDKPTAQFGNYHVSLLALQPFFSFLGKRTIIDKIIEVITPSNKKYKYFSELEVKGLDTDLVLLLDKARGIAGIPFVINSGFRTPAHNKKVGGVANSAHLTGKAVDIRARTGAETYAIIKSAIEVGIKRIGINRSSQFVHLDIDDSKPYPTIYEY